MPVKSFWIGSTSKQPALILGGTGLLLMAATSVLIATASALAGAATNTYPVHTQITAAVFWVGEPPGSGSSENNALSAWDDAWEAHYGGFDDPNNRVGFLPAGFTPLENPFYFDLPYDDFGNSGRRSDAAAVVPWASSQSWGPNESMLKNRWARFTRNGVTCYGQWEDSGPYVYDDATYVFGASDARPRSAQANNAGADVSPALRDCLGFIGANNVDNKVDWQFVESNDVPAGPWTAIVTTRGTYWPGSGSSSAATPSRTPTATATATISATTTKTPMSTNTAGATRTPRPTRTPSPTATSSPAAATSPTSTSTSTPTPSATATTSPTATPTATSGPPGAALVVFGDALGAGWRDSSWKATVNFAETAQVFAGTRSISFSVTAAWGGLYLSTAVPSATTASTSLSFAMRASAAGQRYSVGLIGMDGAFLGTHVVLATAGGDPVRGGWTSYSIPLGAGGFNAAGQAVTGIVIQDNAGTAQPLVYVDEVRFR